MSLLALLEELQTHSIHLQLDQGKLKVTAPKGALSPALQLKLREHKEELLAVLEAGQKQAEGALLPIPALDPAEPAPLSAAQHRLWFLDQLNPGTASLNLPFTVALRGELDFSALHWAVVELGRRHDALRSRVELIGSEPVQRVMAGDLELELVDLSSLPEAQREAALSERRKLEMGRPFDLSQAPLIRCFTFRLKADLHWFMFVTNHVVFDGWSHDILFRELRELYEHRLGLCPLPPAPPVRFADFVRWHRAWLEEPEQAAQLAAWLEKLVGMPQVLELPLDHARPQLMSYRGISRHWKMEGQLVERLRAIATANGCTLNMLVLASFELLLFRYSGQKDFGVGVPVHGRVRPECEELIGMFVNTLVLRSDLPGATTFRELLLRVKESCLFALGHQDLPFEKLVQALAPVRDRTRTPLCQAMFSYQEASQRQYTMAELELEQVPSFSGSTGTDVTFWLRDHGDWAMAVVEACADLFEPSTVERWLRSWQTALYAIAEDPELPLAEVPIIAPEDLERLGEVAKPGLPPEGGALTIHQLLAEQAARRPDQPAAYFEDKCLLFGELEARANRIAHALCALGVGPDVLVGVCLPRGLDLLCALFGVLKAGGAYLPMDPAYPQERLRYLVQDSKAKVVVSLAPNVEGAGLGATLLLLDTDAGDLSACPAEPPALTFRSHQLAYVIYTSGSTGKPKGVLVEHRNALSLFRAFADSVGFEDSVWLAGASASFDMSIPDLLGAVCSGRPVVIVGDRVLGEARDARFGLPELAERYGVTHYQCTPSQAKMLLASQEGRRMLSQLKRLVVGGEALAPDLKEELLETLRGTLINGYGPTETTVYATMGVMRKGEPVTIGRPIGNTSAFVVDETLRLVPYGAVGELCLGGYGVTRGYLARPELTQERFIEGGRLVPEDPSCRLYRSGDLVRFDAEGRLLYLGRNDDQVKLRGFRIELGEIEAALRALGAVKDAVVTVHGFGSDKQLIGYLIVEPGFDGVERLRAELRRQLPDFMVPARYVLLESFPLNANGKVERAALPAPGAATSSAAYVAPADEVERSIAEIWQRVLGVPRVGADDNFFDLGGHSLLAVALFNQLHEQHAVKLPLAALFEHPTVRQLAARVRSQAEPTPSRPPPAFNTIVPIQPAGSLPPFFCVAGAGGNPLNLRHVAHALGGEQPFFGLQYRGVDGELEPHTTIEDMALEFLRDVRRVQPQGPYYLGGYSLGGLAAYEMARLLEEAGEEVPLLVLLDTFNPALPGWSARERVAAHVQRLRQEGPAYLQARLKDRAKRELARARRAVRARLGQSKSFQYRVDVVEQAGKLAEQRFLPRPYGGRVLLLQAELHLSPSDGIGYRADESNGWRPYLSGELVIEKVPLSHHDIVTEEAAPHTARLLANALARAREHFSSARERQKWSSPSPRV